VAEHEVDRAENAQAGPEKIERQRFFHIEMCKGDEDQHGDDFLENFQLPKVH